MYTCQMFCYIVDKNSETHLEVLKKFYNRENQLQAKMAVIAYPWSYDYSLKTIKHRFNGNGGIHTAEVKNGVTNGWGPIIKGLDD